MDSPDADSKGDHRPAEAHANSPALTTELYGELRSLARTLLGGAMDRHTLQPTALVHELYLRFAGRSAEFQNRVHFMAAAARAMRQILTDYARRAGAQKRGGNWIRVPLDEAAGTAKPTDLDLIALDSALTRLGLLNERQAQIVALRFFAGLSMEDVAGLLGVSVETVKRDWRMARAWLMNELSEQ